MTIYKYILDQRHSRDKIAGIDFEQPKAGLRAKGRKPVVKRGSHNVELKAYTGTTIQAKQMFAAEAAPTDVLTSAWWTGTEPSG
jgi:hypothetical protein